MRKVYLFIILNTISLTCFTQSNHSIKKEKLDFNDVLLLAQSNSLEIIDAKQALKMKEVQYLSYKAQLLPNIHANFTLPYLNHRMERLQNYETGSFNYVQSYMMQMNAEINLTQNIILTGGNISLSTHVDRLDQFAPNRLTTYYNQPLFLTYSQPILGTFNSMKWNRKLEPLYYERAKYIYLEAVETINQQTVEYFFQILSLQKQIDAAKLNLDNSKKLFEIWRTKYELKMANSLELSQLKLRVLNDEIFLKNLQLEYNASARELKLFLGYPQEVDLEFETPALIPSINLDEETVVGLVKNNKKVQIDLNIQKLEKDAELERVKKEKEIKVNLFVRIGFQKSSNVFGDIYDNPLDQESVNIGISIPLLDWGIGKKKFEVAKSKAALQAKWIERNNEELYTQVRKFVELINYEQSQYLSSKKAETIALKRYELAVEMAKLGKLTITDMITTQVEKDQATIKTIQQLKTFWTTYYALRKLTMYDFIENKNLIFQ